MKQMALRTVGIASLTFLLLGGMVVPCEAASVYVGGEAVSSYLYHGITYNDGLVFQPYVDITQSGFGFTVWTNFDIDDYNDTLDAPNFSEVDLDLRYEGSFKGFNYSVMWAEYLYPNTPFAGSREIIVTLDREVVKGFTPGIKVHYDFDEVDDVYAILKAKYEYGFTDELSANIGADFAVAGENIAPARKAGLHNFVVTLGGNYQVLEPLSLGAYIQYMNSLDHAVLNEDDMDVHFLGAITAGYAF